MHPIELKEVRCQAHSVENKEEKYHSHSSMVIPVNAMRFSAIIQKEGEWYFSLCPELDVASQGRTVEEALSNLQEAVELYLIP